MTNADKKILVVDDEAMLLDMLVTVFKDEGYQVDSAKNGTVALNLLKSRQYDLLATDLFMPEMNGIELIQHCQNLSPDTKTILLCGGGKDLEARHGDKQIRFRSKTYEIDLFMKKPCRLSELLSNIENILVP